MKFCFFTIGCKVNQFETQSLERIVCSLGHDIVSENANFVIINTCSVTSSSEHKNIRAINRLKKSNPDAVFALCGCFAQVNQEKVDKIESIDVICGTDNRKDVIDLCLNYNKNKINRVHNDISTEFEILPAGILANRTRALVKIQDGCDNFCSYCIIPYSRGRVRSMPSDEVYCQITDLIKQGIKEIIITGIEISSYAKDIEDITLTSLIDNICSISQNTRIRLGSLEPRTVTKTFCNTLSKHKNLCRHFHLSLQSGSNNILKLMNRRYTTEEYFDKLITLRKCFDNPSITTDIIVGFPQETDERFNETIDFIKKCRFADIHVFPFSKRHGTKAAYIDGHLSRDIKNSRANIVKSIQNSISKEFLELFINKNIDVLIENEKNGMFVGHSDRHFSVIVDAPNLNKQDIVSVKVIQNYNNCLYALPFWQ